MKKKSAESPEVLFLTSALCLEGVESLTAFREWWQECKNNYYSEVVQKNIGDLEGWSLHESTGNLVHRSGRFFSIEGLEVDTNFGFVKHWTQPIIVQPEIGILGFLTKRFNGILHFLVQAKMEPGNVNQLQLSPTVQATHSNYTKAHGGRSVPYLEWFIDCDGVRYVVDQLQSEQGARFLAKRNRNVIIQVPDDQNIPLLPGFAWLTLGQLYILLAEDNFVNMDSRTVLSCIRFFRPDNDCELPSHKHISSSSFTAEVFLSSVVGEENCLHTFDTLVSWMTRMKVLYRLSVRRVPLNQVSGWRCDGRVIRHETGRYFTVIGVKVQTDNREVSSWCQPLIESAKGGIICFLCQKKSGVLHFLVQARVEPGNLDCVEMAPTIQWTPSNYSLARPEAMPPFIEFLRGTPKIQYDTLQSEEGGRFYHDQNRYLVIELEQELVLELPINYIWMSIRQMKEFIRFNNYFNIEARGLLACLSLDLSTRLNHC